MKRFFSIVLLINFTCFGSLAADKKVDNLPLVDTIIYTNVTAKEIAKASFLFNKVDKDLHDLDLETEKNTEKNNVINNKVLSQTLKKESGKLVGITSKANKFVNVYGHLSKKGAPTRKNFDSVLYEFAKNIKAIAILDTLTINLRDLKGLKKTHNDGAKDPSKKISILVMKVDTTGLYDVQTRGMIKFGYPDLLMTKASSHNIENYYYVMSALINALVEGNLPTPKSNGKSHVWQMKMSDKSKGLKIKATLNGSINDPEFHNKHLFLEVL